MIGGSRVVTSLHRRRHRPAFTTLAILLSSHITTSFAFPPKLSSAFNPTKKSSCSSTPTSTSTSISMSTSTSPQPPTPRRDESLTVLAGLLPPTHPLAPILTRQSATSTNPLLNPPRAIPDPYGWLRDESRSSPEVLGHLAAENAYTAGVTEHLKGLRGRLYEEMVGTIQETDYTTPGGKDGKWWYYTRTNKGESYKVYCRAPYGSDKDVEFEWDGTVESPVLEGEEKYLDVNTIAKGQAYCSVSSTTVSKSQRLLAYMLDVTGDEIYSLHIQDLTTGETLHSDSTPTCSGSVVWGDDENTVFYLTLDATQRPDKVYRRKLNGEKEDELLFQQDDPQFWTGVGKSSDGRYLIVETSSTETAEVHYLDLHDPAAHLKCVAERRPKVLYDVDHWNGFWVITSNVGPTPNMRLMTCRVGDDPSKWEDVTTTEDGSKLFDGGYDRSLEGVQSFQNHIVASGRYGGIPAVWILAVTSDETTSTLRVTQSTPLTFAESAYDIAPVTNYDYASTDLVLYYASLITPPQSLRISLSAPNDPSTRAVLKEKNVPGYVKGEYGCERVTVTARDGTEVPVSIVYRRDAMERYERGGETIPVHLKGYGSYGACSEADFSAQRLSLLNRGMAVITAHVRGGAEMGRQWYEEPKGAKYLCKENTFNDFVDVARWLIEDKKLTTPQQLSIEGRSAGGLLIGASINQAPELFRVAILGVPFVDVAATMVDSSIPLTTNEWEEWGNPNEEKFFDYMMGYSPMNNVKKGGKYPSCLLTGGLNDPRVQFWEPAKFTAELRHAQDSEDDSRRPICMKMDMTAGHFSASDRYKYLRELSFDYAFLLDQLGLAGTEDE